MPISEMRRFKSTVKPKAVPRDPEAVAEERRRPWSAMIDGVKIRNRPDLARRLGVSRARVTQVLGPIVTG